MLHGVRQHHATHLATNIMTTAAQHYKLPGGLEVVRILNMLIRCQSRGILSAKRCRRDTQRTACLYNDEIFLPSVVV